jgi:hypothetical protein
MTDMNELKWHHGESKTKPPGWYATLHCWDADEGLFPDAHFWDGNEWDWNGPITSHAGPFESEDATKAWADEHDPESLL